MYGVRTMATAAYCSGVRAIKRNHGVPKLLAAAPLREEIIARRYDFDSMLILSLRSGVSERQIKRVMSGCSRWVTDHVADALCIAIGTHPFYVFGDAWHSVQAA